MKISDFLALLIVSGILLSATAGDAQIPQPMLGPRHIERNTPDGGQSIIRPRDQQLQNPLAKAQASQEVENYLKSTGSPNLKLGKIRENGENFEADILAKDGSLLDKILVNKNTGEMRSKY